MSTALDLDLATLVGELPAVPCEHQAHANGLRRGLAHNDEPASHYVQARCDCGRIGNVTAVCPAFAAFALTSMLSQCPGCFDVHPANQNIRVLGPVNGRAS